MKARYMIGTGLLAALSLGSPGQAAVPRATPPALAASCLSPVLRGDSAASILRRFGVNARRATLPGAEGKTIPGVVIYPRDPRRRMEVTFDNSRMMRVSSVSISGAHSLWSMGGLSLGDGIDKVIARNGRAFTFSGFDWDYGGFVTDLKGGALQQLPGGCRMGIRLALPANVTSTPDALMGDVQVESTNPALRRVRPIVSELILNF